MLVYDMTVFIVLGLLLPCEMPMIYSLLSGVEEDKLASWGSYFKWLCLAVKLTQKFWFAFKTLLKPYSVLFERHTLKFTI